MLCRKINIKYLFANIYILYIFCIPWGQSTENTQSIAHSPYGINSTHLSPHSYYSLSNRFQKIKSLFSKGQTFDAIDKLTELEQALTQLSGKPKIDELRKAVQDLWSNFWESEANAKPSKSDKKQLSLLGRSYPEMLSLIQNHTNLTRLMEILSQSRLNLDYKATKNDDEGYTRDASNKGKLNDRIEWALKKGLYLSLGNGIYTTPLSGSFRRHILFKMDALTKQIDYNSAIEIKMAGEIEDKRAIDAEDFDYAQLYQNRYQDNTVTEVILMDAFEFNGQLYGKTVKDVVTVIFTRYPKSSNRLQHFIINKDFDSIILNSGGHYQTPLDVQKDIFNQTMDLVCRMNADMGVIGRRDMHLENFTISQNPNEPVSIKWVNDFGDFGSIMDADHILLQDRHLKLKADDGTDVNLSPEQAYSWRAVLRDFEAIYGNFTAYGFDKTFFSKEKALALYIRAYNKYAPENLQLKLTENDTKVQLGGKDFYLASTREFKKQENFNPANTFLKIFEYSTASDPDMRSADFSHESYRHEANVRTSKILYESNPQKFREKYSKALAEAIDFFEKNRTLTGENQVLLTSFQIAISS